MKEIGYCEETVKNKKTETEQMQTILCLDFNEI